LCFRWCAACFRSLARLNPGVCYDTAGGTEDEAEHVPGIVKYVFLRGEQGDRMNDVEHVLGDLKHIC
jgi:hypothetical protein